MRRVSKDVKPVRLEHSEDLSDYSEWIEEVGEELDDPSFSVDSFRKWSFQRPETFLRGLESDGFSLLAGEVSDGSKLDIEEKEIPVEIEEYERVLETMEKAYMAALESDLDPTHYERKTWIGGSEKAQIPLRRLEKEDIGLVICFETSDSYIDMGYLVGPSETGSELGVEVRGKKRGADNEYETISSQLDDLVYELEEQGLELG
jgi:hypothetical protein